MSYIWNLAILSLGYYMGTTYGPRYPLIINNNGLKIGETFIIKSEDDSVTVFGIPIIKSKPKP